MGAQIIAFLPRYLQATVEASALPSPIVGQGDLAMDHVDTSPCEYLACDALDTPPSDFPGARSDG